MTSITAQLPTDVATLQAMLVAAYTDAAYGCLTRAGLEALHTYAEGREVVFFDLDGMHDLNAELGYAEVDARIKAAIASVRGDDVVSARWYSGDEIVVIVNAGEGVGCAQRLLSTMQTLGLSATFGVATLSESLTASVTVGSDLVQAAKVAGNRGTVNF